MVGNFSHFYWTFALYCNCLSVFVVLDIELHHLLLLKKKKCSWAHVNVHVSGEGQWMSLGILDTVKRWSTSHMFILGKLLPIEVISQWRYFSIGFKAWGGGRGFTVLNRHKHTITKGKWLCFTLRLKTWSWKVKLFVDCSLYTVFNWLCTVLVMHVLSMKFMTGPDLRKYLLKMWWVLTLFYGWRVKSLSKRKK